MARALAVQSSVSRLHTARGAGSNPVPDINAPCSVRRTLALGAGRLG
jgi:hypothetical protein